MSSNSKVNILKIKDLKLSIQDKEILHGIDLDVNEGEVHALMGRNGSGKSSFSYALMGHPGYKITNGSIVFLDNEINNLKPDERAKLGIFLSFQYPMSVPGVTVANFLKQAIKSIKNKEIPLKDFRKLLYEKMDELDIDHAFATRYLNDGFSGGEKKRMEVLQMALLEPKLIILDEPDSGLDIDSLKLVSEAINLYKQRYPKVTILLITHYQRILDYVKPDKVHVISEGKIVKSGGPELALELEKRGYDWTVEIAK